MNKSRQLSPSKSLCKNYNRMIKNQTLNLHCITLCCIQQIFYDGDSKYTKKYEKWYISPIY